MIERRIRPTTERLAVLLGGRVPARILLEASTESEWVARPLETLGHTLIVADPNDAPMDVCYPEWPGEDGPAGRAHAGRSPPAGRLPSGASQR